MSSGESLTCISRFELFNLSASLFCLCACGCFNQLTGDKDVVQYCVLMVQMEKDY